MDGVFYLQMKQEIFPIEDLNLSPQKSWTSKMAYKSLIFIHKTVYRDREWVKTYNLLDQGEGIHWSQCHHVLHTKLQQPLKVVNVYNTCIKSIA